MAGGSSAGGSLARGSELAGELGLARARKLGEGPSWGSGSPFLLGPDTIVEGGFEYNQYQIIVELNMI